jgi:hypothetical protein
MAERSIVDIGRFLQAGGLQVRENSAFGGVTPGAHSAQGYHPNDEAIDVTDWSDAVTDGQDWRARTRARRDRFAQLGLSEVLGPGDEGHSDHLHLALKGKINLSDQQLLWARDGRYQDAQGRWQTGMPGMQPGAGQTMASVGSTFVTESVVEPAKPQPAKPQPMDWKPAASDPGRSTDPSSQAYWQRQDMKLWAQANPALAKATMARAGADPAWLEAPAMQTPAAPAAAAPAAAAPVAVAPVASAPVAPKPEDRGALSGTQVGGPRPKGLQPYSFEIHADRPSANGGQTGLIGSYLDGDNPLFQKLAAAYGTYGDNYSRQWRGGDLGAPKRGLSILETRTSGEGMDDPKRQQAEANRLYQTLMADPDVKSGKRPLHFFAGHADVPAGGEMGSAGEKGWNLGVFNALRQRAQQEGRTNFQFHDPVVAGDNDPQANWNRAKALRDQWIQQKAGGSK